MNLNQYQATLPLPPSANNLVRPAVIGWKRTKRGGRKPIIRLVKTREAKAFRAKAHKVLERWPGRNRYDGPVDVVAVFYLQSVASDAPNGDKALHDALKGFAYFDDKQISKSSAVKRMRRVDIAPCVVVTVTPAENPDPELVRRLLASSKRAGRNNSPDNLAVSNAKKTATPRPDRRKRTGIGLNISSATHAPPRRKHG